MRRKLDEKSNFNLNKVLNYYHNFNYSRTFISAFDLYCGDFRGQKF